MKRVITPYFDPEFHNLPERIFGPVCRVCIDNESLQDCTVVKVDSVNKQDLLLEVVQMLTDMNLAISKGYISSDAGWFMDVFHVKDDRGDKITDGRVINSIQQGIGACRERISYEGRKARANKNKLFQFQSPPREPTAIEMTGKDRPGLFSEISAALADLHCNIVEAHAWSHNAHLACVAYISDQYSGNTRIDDRRLAIIEDHLTTVLRATTDTNCPEVKPAGLPEGDGTMASVERRLHQLMVSVRDFDGGARPEPEPTSESRRGYVGSSNMVVETDNEEEKTTVMVEGCGERGYSIVTVQCKDRRRLMFDTVCTLTDLQYGIFHASIDSHQGYAFQEYFVRHVDGCGMITETEKERVVKCLEAAIERRVCEGVRLELSANNRIGLLSDITRVLRENGLAVVRADVATEGDRAVNAFYVRDISGKDVDMGFVNSMRKEMGAIDLDVKKETRLMMPSSPERHWYSIGERLRSQIERFSHNFIVSIK